MVERSLIPPVRAMLARLDDETRTLHELADADFYRILDEPTEDAYRHFLAAIYQFEHAVEAELAAVAHVPPALVARYSHAALLLDDLRALGADHVVFELLARPVGVPPIDSAPRAFGWIYTVQRNTLHHRALYRALAPRLRPTLRAASRYLTAHASDVYERWYELGAELDRVASDDDRVRELVAAARDAFAHQHRWHVEAWETWTAWTSQRVRLRSAR